MPLYLQSKGLVKQHIDSYDYFVGEGLRQIVRANEVVDSDVDAGFYLKYVDVYVGEPSVQEDVGVHRVVTPQTCRLRELTYAAPIYVDVE